MMNELAKSMLSDCDNTVKRKRRRRQPWRRTYSFIDPSGLLHPTPNNGKSKCANRFFLKKVSCVKQQF